MRACTGRAATVSTSGQLVRLERGANVELMRGAVRRYAWGSHTALAEFTGRSGSTSGPEAELWLGAHPGDPAILPATVGQQSLLDTVRADPERQLGAAVRSRFGDELPFLVKVLAVAEPLSLQAHPSADQALAGYLREDRQSVPITSPSRNYRDSRHKPELAVALSPFELLAGFRPAARTAEWMRALAVPALGPAGELLSGPSEADGLRAVFTTWITAPQSHVDVLVAAVLDGATNYLRSGAPEFASATATVLDLIERYPGDAGVLAALLLNRISLAPGEAIFLPAGNLHAYLHGMAVEVMANSDNVLRGGLTFKHVDVPELLRVLDFTPIAENALRTNTHRAGPELVYESPVEDFAASVLELDGDLIGREVSLSSLRDRPHILLCTEGCADVSSDSKELTLGRGAAAWIPAHDGVVRLIARCATKLFRVTVGL
jgi:mannose-6-phosphate isomerase